MALFNLLPFPLLAILLLLIGAGLGSLMNLGIYQLAYRRRPISPWSRPPDGVPPRHAKDRLPIIGWLSLRRESSFWGQGFWLRPLAIELGWAVGLVALFAWYREGGLFTDPAAVSSPTHDVLARWNALWFVFHATLLALLTIATFIDFDEQTIPDWITIPGTLLALAVAIGFPQSRLPVLKADLVGVAVQELHFASPHQMPNWHLTTDGLWIGWTVIAVWCFALLPKTVTFRNGPIKALQYLATSIWPTPRKTTCQLRVTRRRPTPFHWTVLAIFAASVTTITVVWSARGEAWESLCGALLGMAFGGGLTWAVRIIASGALGVEAMGFGDVTLMAMLGAFLGWQPALLIFAFAPFASVIIAIIQLIVSGDQKIAFGPYLCFATLVVLLFWDPIWNQWASSSIFSLGSILLYIIAGSLVLLGALLFAWNYVKYRLFPASRQ